MEINIINRLWEITRNSALYSKNILKIYINKQKSQERSQQS